MSVELGESELREAREDLAAAFRWTARLGMHEGVANHFSLAISSDGKRFLMNPDARHFSKIKASELLLLDADDPKTMDRPDAPDPTAWTLHGRIHANLPQARCVLHLHPKYATVLSALTDSSDPSCRSKHGAFFRKGRCRRWLSGHGARRRRGEPPGYHARQQLGADDGQSWRHGDRARPSVEPSTNSIISNAPPRRSSPPT